MGTTISEFEALSQAMYRGTDGHPGRAGFVLRHSGPAHAPAHRDFNSGGFSLEGPQHQRIAFQQIEVGPVDAVQRMIEQRGGVGQVGDLVGYTSSSAASWAFNV